MRWRTTHRLHTNYFRRPMGVSLLITMDQFVFINSTIKYDLIVTLRRTYFASLLIWAFVIIWTQFNLFFKPESIVHRFRGANTMLYVYPYFFTY